MKRLLLFGWLCVSSALPAAALEQALGNLLDARAAAAAVFDGSRFAPFAAQAVVVPPYRARPAAVLAPAAPKKQPQASAAPAATLPESARGISSGYVGLYPEDDFVLGTGRCETCRGPVEGKWYLLDDVIATPKAGPPAMVWIGSHEMVEGAAISADGRTVRLKDGSVLPFDLTAQIGSNRSYFDASSLAFYQGRTVRIRGEYVERGGVRSLVARTIWPEDFRIDPARLPSADARNKADIDALVGADDGGARKPFQTKLLWEKPGAGRGWEGQPVMGFMLNGGQGDDDESLAGHFSMFTGRFPAGGSMADWMFDNFYSMDSVSEKGIIASMVPMDKYMTDLNSGQSWYRPTDMLVLVMKDQRLPLQLQEGFKGLYAKYYSHEIKYDRTTNPCTAMIVDPLRQAGWNFPEQGKTPVLVAKLLSGVVGLQDKEAGKAIYESLRQEPTHLFPRAAFDSLGGDVLSLAGAYDAELLGRQLSPFEKSLAEDLLAVVWVRLPQIPSSRAFGRDAAGGVVDYFHRAPLDRSQWQTVPTVPRPYPPPH
ncbi:MAG: hypothetical protein NTY77_12175 [Elusimicrobia bacterium]|nr:hypothetical protein [Elusimicrobiota bacterium]